MASLSQPSAARSALLAGALGLPLGWTAWALAQQAPSFPWPELRLSGFLGLGLLAALAFAAAQAAFAAFVFGRSFRAGLRLGALSLLPTLLGLAWPRIVEIRLPAPHDFPLRNLQILLAAQLLSSLGLSLALGLRALVREGALERLAARSLALRLGGLAFVVYLLVGAWAGPWHMTGDAPHYLLMTHSLAVDGDVDLKNNYQSGIWMRFYDFPALEAQLPDQADGRQVSEHKPGLPALLVPGYLLGDAAGARAELAALAALGAGLFFLLCLRLGYSRGEALLGYALFAFSAPWLLHSSNVLTEMPAGLLLLAVLASWQGALHPAWAGPALAALPWLHVRYFAVAPLLAWLDLRERRRAGRAWWPPLAWLALGLGTALLYNRLEYGAFSPARTYAQRGQGWADILDWGRAARALPGLFLDQESGWLTAAPVFGLAGLGLWALRLRRPRLFSLSLAPALLYLAPLPLWLWWSSSMLPNRFLVPLTPLFALWTLEAFKAWGPRPAFRSLAALSWAWALLLSALPWFAWSLDEGRARWLAFAGRALGLDLGSALPSFIRGGALNWAWVAALGLALWLGARRLGPPPRGGA